MRKRLRFHSTKAIQLADSESRTLTGIHLAKKGHYHHGGYGEFDISQQTLDELINNFNANTYNQKIFIDVAHKPENGAAAEITNLYQDGDWLKGDLELTEFGRESIINKKYIYLSIDYSDDWIHSETGHSTGATLFGAGLTIRPFIKGQPGITLAEPNLTHETGNDMNFLELLTAYLNKIQAPANVATTLSTQFDTESKKLSDDTHKTKLLDRYKALGDAAVEQIKTLTAENPGAPVTLNLSTGMSADDVTKMLADNEAAKQLAVQNEAKQLADNVTAHAAIINAADALSDATKKALCDNAKALITANSDAGFIKTLADQQIEQANQLEVARQLSAQGFNVAGSPRITVDDSNSIKRLSESVRNGLRQTSSGRNGRLTLSDKPSPFADEVLAVFDQQNAHKLHQESRALAGEQTIISDTDLPYGVQREVLRESLHDLNILGLVSTRTDPSAQQTTMIPYDQRDITKVTNRGIVREGMPIPGASIRQMMDTAYIFQRKMAMEISNEVTHFSRASLINWDAYARNVESNARVMRELIMTDIANTMQRTADSYGAMQTVGETIVASVTDPSVIKTANYPIVRPHTVYDLQGNILVATTNPIMLAGVAIDEFDGSGTQAAGSYYVIQNANLGYIQIMDETGTPVNATGTVTYSYSNNVSMFDLDVPTGVEKDKHLNGLMEIIGAQKAMMKGDRWENPNFLLMSPILNDICTNAEQFEVQHRHDGTDTNGMGDLARVKAIPTYGTNAPGIDLGDERIIMGVSGTTTYTVAKPYVLGQAFELTDGNNRPIGMRAAYGEEYASIHTPLPIANRYTSVIAYSVAGRGAY